MTSTTSTAAATLAATLLLIGERQSACLAFSSPSAGRTHSSAVNGDSASSSKVDSFAEFCLMRLGLDVSSPSSSDDSPSSSPGASPTVYWVGTGELYEAYSGRLLAKFEGFDVGTGVLVDNDHSHVRQFSRKIFWFRDPMTNEIMTEYNGEEVRPIRYDYQVFDYQRPPSSPNDAIDVKTEFACIGTKLPSILPSIVSGPREVPVLPITTETSGSNRLAFQCPVFIDVETPMGSYQAWENYDYTHDITYPEGQPSICVWARQGSNPPFVENGKGVMRSRAHRVDRYEDVPESIRELVEGEGGEYQLFRHPPKDMAEILRLQEEEEQRRRKR